MLERLEMAAKKLTGICTNRGFGCDGCMMFDEEKKCLLLDVLEVIDEKSFELA